MKSASKLNILWLIAEDFGPALSCYGRRDIRTPNIDNLARQGIRYTRCYTTAPVCSPSRSAFMTGMFQTTLGAHDHRSHRDDFHPLPTGVRVAPDWFRDAGYVTGNIRTTPTAVRGTGKTDWNFATSSRPFDTDDWIAMVSDGRPFFGVVNLWETHRVFDAPRMTDPRDVDLPPYYPDVPEVREDYARYLDSAVALDAKVGVLLDLLERQRLAENTVVFFLGDNGEAHIRGKQFCYEEGLHVPMIVRMPTGVARSESRAGSVENRLVMAVDWLPTSLELAGLRAPAVLQGRPVLGRRASAPHRFAFAARDRCDETEIRLRTVRDRRYRWIRNLTPNKGFFEPNAYKAAQYPSWNLVQELGRQGKLSGPARRLVEPTLPAEELYDLEEDPHELNNLAAVPECANIRLRLDRALRLWMRDCDDPHLGLLPSH